jgi:hypothetical protein
MIRNYKFKYLINNLTMILHFLIYAWHPCAFNKFALLIKKIDITSFDKVTVEYYEILRLIQ